MTDLSQALREMAPEMPSEDAAIIEEAAQTIDDIVCVLRAFCDLSNEIYKAGMTPQRLAAMVHLRQEAFQILERTN